VRCARQLVTHPGAIAALARRALTVCHINPETLEDELTDACAKRVIDVFSTLPTNPTIVVDSG